MLLDLISKLTYDFSLYHEICDLIVPTINLFFLVYLSDYERSK